jgi:hypothetical protein
MTMTISLRTKILLGLALAVTAYVLMGPGDEQTVEAAKGGTAASAATRTVNRVAKQSPSRGDASMILYFLTHRVSQANAADTLFASHSWYIPPPPPPPPPKPVLTTAQEAALKAPVAPPVPFTYMGSYTPDGSQPVVFLTKGDRVYDVRVGDVLDGTYSVDSLSNGQLLLTYKPLQIQQQITIGSAQ